MMAPESNVQVNQKSNTSVGVTVSTKTESTAIGDGVDWDPLYFKTIPGLIKIIQLLLGIICMACASPAATNFTRFFMVVVAASFIFTILLCITYFFMFKNLMPKVPWLIVELAGTGVAVVFYFIATIVQLSMTSGDYYIPLKYHGFYSPYIAAGCMALFNTVAYGAGLFFLYKEWRSTSPTSMSPAQNGSAS